MERPGLRILRDDDGYGYRQDETDAYMTHIEAERDTLQAQLTKATRLLITASQSLIDANMEEGLVFRIADYLNPPKEQSSEQR